MGEQIFAIAPAEGAAHYFTAGKAYPVTNSDKRGFWVQADNGVKSYCLWEQCAHLHGGDWKREARSLSKDNGE